MYKTLCLFKSINVTEKNFIDNKDVYWRKLFHVNKFETINRKFAHEIVTDGRAVSILLQKPKKEKKTNGKIDLDNYDVVWGLDPGRRDLFVASDCNNNMIKCSVGEYYNDAKFTWCSKKIRNWYDCDNYRVRDILNRIPTLKVVSIDEIGVYLTYMFRNIDSLLDFHFTKNFRGIKFKRYIASKKKVLQLCKKIAVTGFKTLVGFGDWSNNDKIIKKHPKGPVKILERELKRHCSVISIDEYRTSKKCNDCKCDLENMYFKRFDIFGDCIHKQKIHTVLRCTNVACARTCMNRDVNASQNILEILESDNRPLAFRR